MVKYSHNNKHRQSMWQCLCECGVVTTVCGYDVTSGHTRSCGCIGRGTGNTTHGMSNNREYSSWCGMKSRCYNEKATNFHRYGGRGITICDRWLSSFTNFYLDMGSCPGNKSIDRKDNNGNYTPSNCRWATCTEQSDNTSRTKHITYNGKTMNLSEWSKRLGDKYGHVVSKRLLRGWSEEEAVSKGIRGR